MSGLAIRLSTISMPLRAMLLLSLAVFAIGWGNGLVLREPMQRKEIVLVVPDDLNPLDPIYLCWLDALREEGLMFETMGATALIRASAAGALAVRGLILPDTFHRQAGVALIDAIKTEVQRGSKLLLAYDAAIATPAGFINTPNKMRHLTGVDYALYEEHGKNAAIVGRMLTNTATANLLQIPPGRLQTTTGPNGLAELMATTYLYGAAEFPHFITREKAEGVQLMRSGTSVLANLRQLGAGQVLFVNMPLGYLKQRTDGIWLHSFLRYFAEHLLQGPRLLAAPDGIGGMVINWHIDDRKALGFLPMLNEIGFGDFGPYSIHLTAGPDSNRVGDKLGMDLDNNPQMQQWVRDMRKRGNSIGSHGGWIHNVFSLDVTEASRAVHEQLIHKNIGSVAKTVDARILEYSAPSGNQPQWSTDLIEQAGIRAYYTTGNVGLGPTRGYVDAGRGRQRAWAFPISALDQAASFEEAADARVPSSEMKRWMIALADYCRSNGVVRLFYFHPIGVSMYQDAAASWVKYVRQSEIEGVFRMYTMAQMAEFLDRREGISWSIKPDVADHHLNIQIDSDVDLAQQVLALPKSRFAQPKLLEGNAQIIESKDSWRIHAGSGRQLRLKTTENNHG